MNKFVKLKVGATLLAFILLGSIGMTSAVAPPATPPADSTLAGRINQRKTEQGTVLSDNDQKRIAGTCSSAQSKLRQLQNDAIARFENHTTTYDTIDARLWVAIGRLKLAGQDTFTLEKQRQTLSDKTAAFAATATNYKQVLDDSLVITCQADPTGFKALLDTTRVYNDQLLTQATDIHDYVVNTIKPTLVDYVAKLQAHPAQDTGGQ